MKPANEAVQNHHKGKFLKQHNISPAVAARIFNGEDRIGGLTPERVFEIRTTMTNLGLSFTAPANGTFAPQNGNGVTKPSPAMPAPQIVNASSVPATNGTPAKPAAKAEPIQPTTFAEIAQAVPGVDAGKLRRYAEGAGKIPPNLLSQIYDSVGGKDNFELVVQMELGLA